MWKKLKSIIIKRYEFGKSQVPLTQLEKETDSWRVAVLIKQIKFKLLELEEIANKVEIYKEKKGATMLDQFNKISKKDIYRQKEERHG